MVACFSFWTYCKAADRRQTGSGESARVRPRSSRCLPPPSPRGHPGWDFGGECERAVKLQLRKQTHFLWHGGLSCSFLVRRQGRGRQTHAGHDCDFRAIALLKRECDMQRQPNQPFARPSMPTAPGPHWRTPVPECSRGRFLVEDGPRRRWYRENHYVPHAIRS